MGLFHSTKDKKNLTPPAGALSSKGSYSYRGKFSERISRNKALQYVVLSVSLVLVLFYIWFSTLTLADIYSKINQNTKAFKSEKNVIGVSNYEVDTDGVVSFETIEGLYYDKEDVQFIVVASGVLPKETVYYVPSENVLITDLSMDFALNYLRGNHYWLVVVYTILVEVLRMYVARSGGTVMRGVWVKVITWGMFFLTLAHGIMILLLLS